MTHVVVVDESMSKEPVRLVFLDIDGVLNCAESFFGAPRQTTITFLGPQVGYGSVQREEELVRRADVVDPIDVDKVARLNKIVDQGKAKVVVSSTWRLSYTMKDLVRRLESAGFYGDVVGTTPWDRSDDRGQEVLAWLLQNTGEAPVHLAILDDSPFKGFDEHFVRTTFQTGLADEHVEMALRILERPWKRPPR